MLKFWVAISIALIPEYLHVWVLPQGRPVSGCTGTGRYTCRGHGKTRHDEGKFGKKSARNQFRFFVGEGFARLLFEASVADLGDAVQILFSEGIPMISVISWFDHRG